jgi:hypothetical protein
MYSSTCATTPLLCAAIQQRHYNRQRRPLHTACRRRIIELYCCACKSVLVPVLHCGFCSVLTLPAGLLHKCICIFAGPLLGSGSFGRVYAARWQDADVAVKIIPCRTADLQRVLHEAQIMLRLRHSNVVGAITYAVKTSVTACVAPSRDTDASTGCKVCVLVPAVTLTPNCNSLISQGWQDGAVSPHTWIVYMFKHQQATHCSLNPIHQHNCICLIARLVPAQVGSSVSATPCSSTVGLNTPPPAPRCQDACGTSVCSAATTASTGTSHHGSGSSSNSWLAKLGLPAAGTSCGSGLHRTAANIPRQATTASDAADIESGLPTSSHSSAASSARTARSTHGVRWSDQAATAVGTDSGHSSSASRSCRSRSVAGSLPSSMQLPSGCIDMPDAGQSSTGGATGGDAEVSALT